jgi:hypothetical protein
MSEKIGATSFLVEFPRSESKNLIETGTVQETGLPPREGSG